MKTLQVMIEGRNYSLQVSEQDAPSMQKIVDEVNETLKSLHISFPNKDRQDCMAMALLTVAVKLYPGQKVSRPKSRINWIPWSTCWMRS